MCGPTPTVYDHALRDQDICRPAGRRQPGFLSRPATDLGPARRPALPDERRRTKWPPVSSFVVRSTSHAATRNPTSSSVLRLWSFALPGALELAERSHVRAVGLDDRAAHIFGGVRGQEGSDGADLLWRAEPAPRELPAFALDLLLGGEAPLAGRIDPARLDHIDIDAVPRQLVGHRPPHLVDRRFARVVRRGGGKRPLGQHRGDDDDLAAATLPDHLPGCQLAGVER